jgi:hypothetical protein
MKRHQIALNVQEGGQDFAEIARALAAAAEEAVKDGVGAECDPAVRAIAYRLARLCRVDDISYGYDPTTLADTFCTLMNECKSRAQETTPPSSVLEGTAAAAARLGYDPGRRPTR